MSTSNGALKDDRLSHAEVPRNRRGSLSVRPEGGPPASTFSWSAGACRIIVLVVWGVTPAAWIYILWSVTAPILTDVLPQPPSSGFKGLLHLALITYASAEALFSIYFFHLVKLAQARPPLPAYSRAFLRQTLARALEDRMKSEDVEKLQAKGDFRPDLTRSRSLSLSKTATFSELSFLDKRHKLAPDDPRAVEWREMFRWWFLGTPWEKLGRDNVLEWLGWSFYGMHLEECQTEWEQEGRPTIPSSLEEAEEQLEDAEDDGDDCQVNNKLAFLYHGLYLLEARAGKQLEEGRRPSRSIRLTLDKVNVTSRPLIKYLVTGFFNIMLERRTRKAGFKKVVDAGMEYLIRMPEDWKAGSEETQPVLFIHGLGMGLAQYASLVSYFEQHPSLKSRPLVLLVQPHLSMSFFHPEHRRPPSKIGTTKALAALVQKWGFEDGLTVVSHSNGTIVHGWLLKVVPELVKRSCFIDPVTFCLWEPTIAYNFLYRPPKTGIEILMRYFVGEELGIAILLQRYFDWSSNILWFEEIPNSTDNHATAFFLAGKDAILNAKRTAEYLCNHGAKYHANGGNVRLVPGQSHGEALITGGTTLVEVMDWITETRT